MGITRKQLGNRYDIVVRAFKTCRPDNGLGGLAFDTFVSGWQAAWKEQQREAYAATKYLKTTLADKDKEIKRLKEGLQEVIDFRPNDTDWPDKPTRDECLEEIKHFARIALQGKDNGGDESN